MSNFRGHLPQGQSMVQHCFPFYLSPYTDCWVPDHLPPSAPVQVTGMNPTKLPRKASSYRFLCLLAWPFHRSQRSSKRRLAPQKAKAASKASSKATSKASSTTGSAKLRARGAQQDAQGHQPFNLNFYADRPGAQQTLSKARPIFLVGCIVNDVFVYDPAMELEDLRDIQAIGEGALAQACLLLQGQAAAAIAAGSEDIPGLFLTYFLHWSEADYLFFSFISLGHDSGHPRSLYFEICVLLPISDAQSFTNFIYSSRTNWVHSVAI